MKTLLASAAALALLSAPALAQSDGVEPTDPQAVEQPAVPEVAPKADAQQEAIGLTEMTFLAEQRSDQKLASEWIGRTVYSSDDENIGDINDLILAADGGLEGVVLGVGGFLGIGVADRFRQGVPQTVPSLRTVPCLAGCLQLRDADPPPCAVVLLARQYE